MEFIRLEKRGRTGVITLDRPPVNALTYQMYAELHEVFEEVGKDSDIWCAVIRAQGKLFCAGNDVRELNSRADGSAGFEDYGAMVEKGLSAVVKCPVPVIAAVQGTAVGAGFCICTYSDVVLASDRAKFGITEIKVGIIGGAPEASWSLPPKVVRYMALTGDLLTAEEAFRYGLVRKIVPEESLLDEALALAERITANPPAALRYMKESLENIYDSDELARKIGFDGEKTALHQQTDDYKEALRAFVEKRPPIYTGR